MVLFSSVAVLGFGGPVEELENYSTFVSPG